MNARNYALSVIGAYSLAAASLFVAGAVQSYKTETLNRLSSNQGLDSFTVQALPAEIKKGKEKAFEFNRTGLALLVGSPIALGFGAPFAYFLFRGDMDKIPLVEDRSKSLFG